MSTLLVDELYPGVTFAQPVRINRRVNLSAIRPWVYLNGTLADGEFRCVVKQGANILVTKDISYTDINTVKTEDYAHGFIRFDFDSLMLNVAEGNTYEDYTIEFSMVNHTRDTDNFLGIVRRWEDKTYPTYDGVGGEALSDFLEPAGLELFEYSTF